MTEEELQRITADLRVVHKLKAVIVMTLDENGSLFSLAGPDGDQEAVLKGVPAALREAANKVEAATEGKKHETQLS